MDTVDVTLVGYGYWGEKIAEDFALSIINDREPKVTGQDGLAVVKTLEEIDNQKDS